MAERVASIAQFLRRRLISSSARMQLLTSLLTFGLFPAVALSQTVDKTAVGLKLDAANDHVAVLPLGAREALLRFGPVLPVHSERARNLASQLMKAVNDPTTVVWDGPPLMVSHQTVYDTADIKQVRATLMGTRQALFDPLNAGSEGAESYVVVVSKIDQAASMPPRYVAIAFVFKGEEVNRIVVAPQPWITLTAAAGAAHG